MQRLSGDGSAWVEGLARRLRAPALWAAFGAIYLPYLAYTVWESHLMPPLPTPMGWVHRALGPFLLFGACIWLSPLPWQWAWPPGRSRSLWRGALAGLLFSEAFVALRAVLICLLKIRAHEDPEWLEGLLVNLSFLGPAMMLVGGAQAHREASDRERALYQRQAEEAQTRLLQSQLHPHVLFNSLNGLAELVLTRPKAAERSIRALSDLLRKLLDASESTYLPLRAERQVVEDYLALEALRLGDRLQVQWDWDPAVDDLPFIPLALQPLVENALKHGIAPEVEGGMLRLEARREGAILHLAVRNTGGPLRDTGGRGFGLPNLRHRLALAYGEAAVLSLTREDGWTSAELRVRLAA